MIVVLLFLAARIGAVIDNVIASEVFAWMPRWAERLLQRALRKLPVSLQERMREEWLRELQHIPGNVWKLKFAASLALRGGSRIAANGSTIEKRASLPAYWRLIASNTTLLSRMLALASTPLALISLLVDLFGKPNATIIFWSKGLTSLLAFGSAVLAFWGALKGSNTRPKQQRTQRD
jgi:hypothetical protein